jgi:hypothetical protein
MSRTEAEQIVNQVGAIIGKGGPFHGLSSLPVPLEIAKEAFQLYVCYLIEDFGSVAQEQRTALGMTYGNLALFIDDAEAEHLNKGSVLAEKMARTKDINQDPAQRKLTSEFLQRFAASQAPDWYSELEYLIDHFAELRKKT